MIKKNKHTVDTAITLFTQCLLYLCYFGFVIERDLLMVLVFYNKGMLKKEAMQKKTASLGFFFFIERTQLNAAHEQSLEKLR